MFFKARPHVQNSGSPRPNLQPLIWNWIIRLCSPNAGGHAPTLQLQLLQPLPDRLSEGVFIVKNLLGLLKLKVVSSEFPRPNIPAITIVTTPS